MLPPGAPCDADRSGDGDSGAVEGNDQGSVQADGPLQIDNSSAEEPCGERAAVMDALIGSDKFNGLDPELYLRICRNIII